MCQSVRLGYRVQLPDVDGVALESLSITPRLFKVTGLLKQAQVDGLMRLARPLLRASLRRDIHMVGSLRDATTALDRQASDRERESGRYNIADVNAF